ncbi:MAG: thioredoxin [Lachnospiraceae bacterium]|nr:thioredoxin [Lachnospiraceae bacterium]
MAEVNVSEKNFDTEVLQADLPVLLDFWATWCGPCKMMGMVLGEIDATMSDKVKICKVNVDEEPELAQRFGVMSIPTLVVFRDGKQVNTSIGFKSKEDVLALLGM